MTFHNLVVEMKLVIASLVVLNSLGIVSPQNELEHSLATECYNKGMTKNSNIENIINLIDKAHCFLGYICGDKCLRHYDSICECGGTTFDSNNDYALYCCIGKNETCTAKQGIPQILQYNHGFYFHYLVLRGRFYLVNIISY